MISQNLRNRMCCPSNRAASQRSSVICRFVLEAAVGFMTTMSMSLFAPGHALARPYIWTNPEGGLITDRLNWFPPSIFTPGPGPGDAVAFQLPEQYSVRFNGAGADHVEHQRATIGQGEVTFNLLRLQLDPWRDPFDFAASLAPDSEVAGSLLSPLTAVYEVNSLANNSLLVTTPANGATNQDTYFEIVNGEVRTYSAVVDSGTSHARGHMIVGSGGLLNTRGRDLGIAPIWNGSMRVENGGSLQTGVVTVSENWYHLPHSDGRLIITGSGSNWHGTAAYIGGSENHTGGFGSLQVADQGSAKVDGLLTIWDDGHVSVAGGGTLDVGALDDEGGSLSWSTGTLRVRNQHSTLDPRQLLGDNLLIGNDKTFDHRRHLTVGANDAASLHVFGNGVASVGSAASSYGVTLGQKSTDGRTAEGTLTVVGPDAQWSGNVNVGGSDDYLGGAGSLDVSNGASPVGDLKIALNNDAFGEAVIRDPGTRWTANRTVIGLRGNVDDGSVNATVDVENGAALKTAALTIADNAGANAALRIDGSDSLVVVDGGENAHVARRGHAEVVVSDGATFQTIDTPSTVAVDGAAVANVVVRGASDGKSSRWSSNRPVTVAQGGAATVRALDGGQIDHNSLVHVANQVGSQATLSVIGPGSRYEARFPTLASSGEATLDVLEGGVFQAEEVFSAVNPGAHARMTVSGVGSGLIVAADSGDDLNLADGGTAELTVAGGGQVSARGIRLAQLADGVATMTVRDGLSQVHSDQLEVGYAGAGAVSVSRGGRLETNSFARVGRFAGASGQVTVENEGSRWNVGKLFLGGQDSFAGGTAGLEIRDAGVVHATDELLLWDKAELRLDGGLLSARHVDHTHGGEFHFESGRFELGGFDGELVNAGGVLAPGAGSGDLSPMTSVATVSDDYFQLSEAALQIEIGGVDNSNVQAAQYDALSVGAVAALDGTLQVELVDAFEPALGDAFKIVSAGVARLGFFAREILPLLPEGLDWFVGYEPTAVSLSVVEPGDFNGDGVVDSEDLLSWEADFGAPASAGRSGFSGANLLDWQRGLSNSPIGRRSPAAAVQGVPEPTSLLLLGVGSIAVFLRSNWCTGRR